MSNKRAGRTVRSVEDGLRESDAAGVRADASRGEEQQDGGGLGGRRGTIQISGGVEACT